MPPSTNAITPTYQPLSSVFAEITAMNNQQSSAGRRHQVGTSRRQCAADTVGVHGAAGAGNERVWVEQQPTGQNLPSPPPPLFNFDTGEYEMTSQNNHIEIRI
jgi:hypothetical protein